MKVRTGFVSNSSSSSFLIACKQEAECYYCGRGGFDLPEFLRHMSENKCDCDSTHITAEGHNEIMKDLDWLEDDDEDDIKELANISRDIKDYESRGYTVLNIRVSYDDPATKRLVKDHAEIVRDWR